jgi:hypothetical protein
MNESPPIHVMAASRWIHIETRNHPYTTLPRRWPRYGSMAVMLRFGT